MRLRSGEVRCRSDTERASPGTFDEVSQESEEQQLDSNRASFEDEQAHHSNNHEGLAEPGDVGTSCHVWPEPVLISSSTSELTWQGDDSAGSKPVVLGPPRTDYYPESQVIYTDKGWSYEIETYNEIYRISTIPSDFFGNTLTWPEELSTAHKEYKDTERPLLGATRNYIAALDFEPLDHPKIYGLLGIRYRLALTAATQRANFMKMWPSAFNFTENNQGHVYWASKLVEEARASQKEGLVHFKAAWPTQDPNGVRWLVEPIDTYSIVGSRIYAMSPTQYLGLRQQVQAKKVRKREEIEDMRAENWAARANPHPTLTRPNLPPLKTGVRLPKSSHAREEVYLPLENASESLLEDILKYLGSDRSSV